MEAIMKKYKKYISRLRNTQIPNERHQVGSARMQRKNIFYRNFIIIEQ